jgi:hypothetical protein
MDELMDDRWNPGKFSPAEGGNGLPNSTRRLAATKHKTRGTFSEPHGRIENVAP